jgi:hypothetical protein
MLQISGGVTEGEVVREEVRHYEQAPIQITRSVLPAPVVTYIGPGNRWQLEAAYSYADGANVITVPEGFQFDLASIPRMFWGLIAPFELSIAAPLLHDFLYHHQGDLPPGTADVQLSLARADHRGL